ncbi:LGFP repeat-containing protein [Mycolicibacterium brisbanense]
MGLIDDKYAMLGGDHGFLGPPKSPGEDFGRGRRRKYAFGEIRLDLTAPDPQEAFEVHGAILDHLRTVESPTDPWFPTSDELMTRDGAGRISYFDGAAIVWRKDLGAFAVQGAIYNKWIRVGGVRSAVGYPISDEHASTPPTRRSTFEHGVIDWPGHDWRAFAVHGPILAAWQSPQGASLGGVLTDETPAADGSRFSKFEHGLIRWTKATGAVIVP